jgi:NitT/TauT family transport system permease protein
MMRRSITLAGPPLLLLIVLLGLWQLFTIVSGIPNYLLPGPLQIIGVGVGKRLDLWISIQTTFVPTIIGYVLSIVLGCGVAFVMSLSKAIERSIYPYAIVLQTIPIVAIAPLIVIWFGAGTLAIIIITLIIAVFPMISNTVLGLTSTDHNLLDLMRLYNATPLQTMTKLRIPSALPYIMGGMKISAGLSVIGAIVGEFIAGIGGGQGGLGYAITSAALHLQIPYLFANALASSLLGICIFMAVSLLARLALGQWHESSTRREG